MTKKSKYHAEPLFSCYPIISPDGSVRLVLKTAFRPGDELMFAQFASHRDAILFTDAVFDGLRGVLEEVKRGA